MTPPRGAPSLEDAGAVVLRAGLVLVLWWIGSLKFAAYEAEGVYNHAFNSPLLSWAYAFLSVRGFSAVLGVIEITLGAMIASRPFVPAISAVGSLGAVLMFLTTLSFLLTTPGVWQQGYGFPALSGAPGQFLLKDVVLLGAALWSAGEAWAARTREHAIDGASPYQLSSPATRSRTTT